MQAVESLTQLAVSAGNALISSATIKQQAAMAGIGMLQHATGSDQDAKDGKGGQTGGGTTQPQTSPQNTQPNAANITDPAVLEVNKVLQLANALQLLVSGGPNGDPDWDKIRGSVCVSLLRKAYLTYYEGPRVPMAHSRVACMCSSVFPPSRTAWIPRSPSQLSSSPSWRPH